MRLSSVIILGVQLSSVLALPAKPRGSTRIDDLLEDLNLAGLVSTPGAQGGGAGVGRGRGKGKDKAPPAAEPIAAPPAAPPAVVEAPPVVEGAPAVEAPPAEGEVPPAEGEAPPAEGEAPPAEGEAAPAEDEAPPAEDEAPPAEDEAPPAEDEAALAEGEAPPAEDEAPPAEGEAPPAEGEAAEVELAGVFGTPIALEGGDAKQDVVFTKGAIGAFEFEFQGPAADELTVVENTAPAAPPTGFVAIEPNSFQVSLAQSQGAGLTLSKIDYIFDGANPALAAMDLTQSQVGKLCAETNAFVIDPNLGELEFELEENEVTLNLNKAVTAEGEWGIFLPIAAAGAVPAANATAPGNASEVAPPVAPPAVAKRKAGASLRSARGPVKVY